MPKTMEELLEVIVDEDLKSEIQKTIDFERTRASETARKNAKKDEAQRLSEAKESLKKDEEFIKTVTAEINSKANKTATEKVEAKLKELAEQEKELKTKSNKIYVKEKLTVLGFNDEEMENAISLLVSDDEENTKERTDKYLSTVQKTIKEKLEKQKKEELGKIAPTSMNNGRTIGLNEKEIRDEFKKAIDNADFGTQAYLIAIAQKNNIKL